MTVIEFYLHPWAPIFASKTIERKTYIVIFVHTNRQTDRKKERERKRRSQRTKIKGERVTLKWKLKSVDNPMFKRRVKREREKERKKRERKRETIISSYLNQLMFPILPSFR